MNNIIKMGHGSGGGMSRDLIKNLFQKYFSNPVLDKMNDAGIIELKGTKLAFTTDSFVVKPIFFEGGDIGKLAVSGTVNDLAVMGANPAALTASFIIEEGFEIEKLEKIIKSMTITAEEASIIIAAGDTKVVEKGSADGIFINTSGVGIVPEGIETGGGMAKPGDVIIVSGSIGSHGASIITSREEFGFKTFVKSDAAPLNNLIKNMLEAVPEICVMRDATRGGLAAVLNEIALQSGVKIEILEEKIPVREDVKGVCGLMGLDPLYLANEGTIVVFVEEEKAQRLLGIMEKHKYGNESAIIGRVVDNTDEPMVILKTVGSGGRILDVLSGEPLPRIC
ncbi:MAG: hydrogenase expression/formation protein HypE [Deltaproteobacteria bacterium]